MGAQLMYEYKIFMSSEVNV